MRFKKYLSIVLIVLMIFVYAGCDEAESTELLSNTQTTTINTAISTDTSTSSSITETTVKSTISTTNTDAVIINGIEYSYDSEELLLNNLTLENLEFLKNFKNLKKLHLKNTSIKSSDITPIQELKCLEYLDLSGSYVLSLNPIAELVNLQYLNLSEVKTEDSSADLSCLTQLEYLSLYKVNIAIEFVSELKSLKFINLSRNGTIRDITPLEGLTSLEELHIEDVSNFIDFTPIKRLKSLRSIYLRNASIDCSILANCEDLQIISL
jgi:Leucine-rich repeat (LRR) protein